VRILLILILVFGAKSIAYSQIKIRTENEVKLNILTTILLYPEILYERVKSTEFIGPVKSDYFGYGFSAGVKLPGFTIGSEEPDKFLLHYYPEIYFRVPRVKLQQYHALAFCRFYFNRQHSFGYHTDMLPPQLFFVEPNIILLGYKDNLREYCVGLNVGIKYLNVFDRLTMELHLGGGNNLKRNDASFYYRFGINVAYRFLQK